MPSESLPLTHGPPGAMVAAFFPGVQAGEQPSASEASHPKLLGAAMPGDSGGSSNIDHSASPSEGVE